MPTGSELWETGLPVPLYWRILVRPQVAKPMSKGGIALPDDAREAQDTLNYIGEVIALGALANKHPRLSGELNYPKVGDWIAYGRYAGQIIWFKGTRLLIINDDEVLMLVPDPSALKVYV